MALLTMDQVFSFVESNAAFAELLKCTQICRNLFFLGGIPRWVVDYLLEVKKCSPQSEVVSLDNIDKCFVAIWTKYVDSYLSALETQKLVRLAAFAVSGRMVQPEAIFDETLKWSRLRDSSLCLLLPRTSSDRGVKCDIQVPYTLLQYIGTLDDSVTLANEAKRAFVGALKDLGDLVDSTLYDFETWQSWEVFGACFYALRINALLVLGHSTVTLGELLSGTIMDDETQAIQVKLVPSRVIRCADKFGFATPKEVQLRRSPLQKIDWISTGCIAMNGVGGAGVDIFFALTDAVTHTPVVIVDQRKRQFGKFERNHANKYFDKLSVRPKFFKEIGARLVRGIMNCVSASNLATYAAPSNCFFLSRDENERFHGTLSYHPACSPVISLNSACKTALKTVLKGTNKDVSRAAEEIVKKRAEPSGGFSNSDELISFFRVKRLNVEIDDENLEFSW